MRKAAIGQRFRDMGAADTFLARQIRDRSRHAQHPVIAARGEPHAFGRFGQKFLPRRIRLRHAVEQFAFRFRIGAQASVLITRALGFAGTRHAFGDFRRAFGGRRQFQILRGNARHFDVDIDTVEQRAGKLGLIFLRAFRCAAASLCRVA